MIINQTALANLIKKNKKGRITWTEDQEHTYISNHEWAIKLPTITLDNKVLASLAAFGMKPGTIYNAGQVNDNPPDLTKIMSDHIDNNPATVTNYFYQHEEHKALFQIIQLENGLANVNAEYMKLYNNDPAQTIMQTRFSPLRITTDNCMLLVLPFRVNDDTIQPLKYS